MMMRRAFQQIRHAAGNHLSLLALSMVALLGFLALAIDIGMLAIAKTQAQNAADLAALTAARTLNGNSTNTYNNAHGHHQRPDDLELQQHPGPADSIVAADAHLRELRLQPDHANVQRQLSADDRRAVDRGGGHRHLDQLAGGVQQCVRLAVPAQRHGHGPGGASPARHRPGDGPVRLDASSAPASGSTSTPRRAPRTIPTPLSRPSASTRRGNAATYLIGPSSNRTSARR